MRKMRKGKFKQSNKFIFFSLIVSNLHFNSPETLPLWLIILVRWIQKKKGKNFPSKEFLMGSRVIELLITGRVAEQENQCIYDSLLVSLVPVKSSSQKKNLTLTFCPPNNSPYFCWPAGLPGGSPSPWWEWSRQSYTPGPTAVPPVWHPALTQPPSKEEAFPAGSGMEVLECKIIPPHLRGT